MLSSRWFGNLKLLQQAPTFVVFWGNGDLGFRPSRGQSEAHSLIHKVKLDRHLVTFVPLTLDQMMKICVTFIVLLWLLNITAQDVLLDFASIHAQALLMGCAEANNKV